MPNKENISIFANLKDFEIAPPAVLFDEIISGKKNEDSISQNIEKKKLIKEVQSPFKSLINYAIAPPFSFESILKLVKYDRSKVINISFLKKMISAAAVVAVLIVGNQFYNKKSEVGIAETDVKKLSEVESVDTTFTTAKVDSSLNLNTPKEEMVKTNFTKKQKQVIQYSKKLPLNTRTTARFVKTKIPQFSIGDEQVTIIDNDYLATFASFNENTIPYFLQVEKPLATSITVDQYTDIIVSASMGAMMKKMYKTKKSGKPTRRARKTKEKLEKWKVADALNFDSTNANNPLDPFELGNFIFHK